MQAAVALTNRMLIIQLEELFESFISLINMAIDEKSPYTGGHCQRVPQLTKSGSLGQGTSARRRDAIALAKLSN